MGGIVPLPHQEAEQSALQFRKPRRREAAAKGLEVEAKNAPRRAARAERRREHLAAEHARGPVPQPEERAVQAAALACMGQTVSDSDN